MKPWSGLALLLLLGCSREIEVTLTPSWPPGSQVALLLLDAEGQPVGGGPRPYQDGPITLDVDPAAGMELMAYVYAGDLRPDGTKLLVDCGLSYARLDPPIASPLNQWRTGPIRADTSGALAFASSARQQIPLYTEDCRGEPLDACAGIGITTYLVPPLVFTNLHNLAMSGDHEAFAVGSQDESLAGPMELARIDGVTTLPLAGDGALFGRPIALVWDGGEVFYGIAGPTERAEGNLFAFDRDGHTRPVPNLALGSGIRQISVGADGSVFALGSNGLFEIVKGSTVAQPLLGLGKEASRLAVVSRDEVYVVDDDRHIVHYADGTWISEWQPGVLDTARVLRLGATADRAIGVGAFGTLLRRNFSNQRWEPIPEPESGAGYNYGNLVLLQGDRFVASYEAGGLAIWNGSGWCEHPEALPGSFVVNDLAASPDGLRAYVLTKATPVLGAELHVVEVRPR